MSVISTERISTIFNYALGDLKNVADEISITKDETIQIYKCLETIRCIELRERTNVTRQNILNSLDSRGISCIMKGDSIVCYTPRANIKLTFNLEFSPEQGDVITVYDQHISDRLDFIDADASAIEKYLIRYDSYFVKPFNIVGQIQIPDESEDEGLEESDEIKVRF